MKEFIPHFGDFLHAIFSRESPPRIGEPCACGRLGAMRMCHCNDCMFFETCCSECFVNLHRLVPHHWVEVWNGRFMERCDISKLGYVHTFGHDLTGGPCKAAPIFNFILVDINGVHETKVSFCACIGRRRERVDHLLEAAIFPSTVRLPELGFTFGVLKDFHVQTLTSKKSPYDYMRALRIKTNSAFLNSVRVRQSPIKFPLQFLTIRSESLSTIPPGSTCLACFDYVEMEWAGA